MILLEYQNIKIFVQKVTLWIRVNKFLWLEKLKILCHGHMLLMMLLEKKLFQLFTKKLQKTNQKEFRIKQVIKKKDDKLC